MTDEKTESASKVITGESIKKSKTMLVDENGVDIEQLQDVIQRQGKLIEELSAVVNARDADDAEVTRKLIVSKSARWATPLVYDELGEYSKPDLDELHEFVCRVGKVDLRDVDQSPSQTVYKNARRFPKLSRDESGPYNTNQHSFKIQS